VYDRRRDAAAGILAASQHTRRPFYLGQIGSACCSYSLVRSLPYGGVSDSGLGQRPEKVGLTRQIQAGQVPQEAQLRLERLHVALISQLHDKLQKDLQSAPHPPKMLAKTVRHRHVLELPFPNATHPSARGLGGDKARDVSIEVVHRGELFLQHATLDGLVPRPHLLREHLERWEEHIMHVVGRRRPLKVPPLQHVVAGVAQLQQPQDTLRAKLGRRRLMAVRAHI